VSNTSRAYFERIYADDPDPWKFATKWDELRKYELTVASLPRKTYGFAFEPGCSIGVLTEMLAPRCDRLLAFEMIPTALDQARTRLHSLPHVALDLATIPEDWPDHLFDLVVLSEIAYYFDKDSLADILDRILRTTSAGATIIGVHWRGDRLSIEWRRDSRHYRQRTSSLLHRPSSGTTLGSRCMGEMFVTHVGICLPVHNEEDMLPQALEALSRAMRALTFSGVECRLAVVLDDCYDHSRSLVHEWTSSKTDVSTLVVHSSAHNVGIARQAGCLALIESWSTLDPSEIWLATTDADSQVPTQWLTHQVECASRRIDFWAGRVEISDWSGRLETTSQLWGNRYYEETAPIHGANIGLNAALFLEVGGFPPLATGEDEALRRAVSQTSSTILHDWRMPVRTSARALARAPLGFSYYIDSLEDRTA